MNKDTDPDDMLPEYDLSKGVRGRYAGRFYPVGPWSVGDQVVLDQDLPGERLRKGDVGEVVHRVEGGGAFRVRFGPPAGEQGVVLTLAAPQIRSLDAEEILQARKRG
jgi:hypothetical protein